MAGGDSHSWYRARIAAYETGLLAAAAAARFERHEDECIACRSARETFAAMEPQLEDWARGAGPPHVPADIVARWPLAQERLTGLERQLVLEHLERCGDCREDLAVLGHTSRWEKDLGVAGHVREWLASGASFHRRIDSLEVAGASLPARTAGGDFVDCFDLPDGRLGIALGDVAGRGAEAALLSAMVQGMFAAQAEFLQSPAITAARMNAALTRRHGPRRLVMFFYAVLARDGRLVSCNAGHNPPVLFRREGALARLERGGFPLGVFDEAQYEEEFTTLGPDDWLVITSDGLEDALTGSEAAQVPLKMEIKMRPVPESAEEMVTMLLSGAREHAASERLEDDLTAIVVTHRSSGPIERSAIPC